MLDSYRRDWVSDRAGLARNVEGLSDENTLIIHTPASDVSKLDSFLSLVRKSSSGEAAVSPDSAITQGAHNNNMMLFKRAAKELRGYPVDMVVDLLLVPKEDLEENMKTWAYLMLLHDKAGLDVNYIFESDDEAYLKRALEALPDNFRPRINRRHDDPRTLTISVIGVDGLEKIESLQDNTFPVAMSDGEGRGGIPLRDFVSAQAIGLAQAACAKVRRETPEKFDDAVSDAYPRMLKVYQRTLNLPESEFTPETLKDIITSTAVRRNHAIALALPPIIRLAIAYLKDYHDRLHLLLEAA